MNLSVSGSSEGQHTHRDQATYFLTGFTFPPDATFQILGHQPKVPTLRGTKRKAPVEAESNCCCRRHRMDPLPNFWSSLTICQIPTRHVYLSGEPSPGLGSLTLDHFYLSAMGLQVVVPQQPPPFS